MKEKFSVCVIIGAGSKRTRRVHEKVGDHHKKTKDSQRQQEKIKITASSTGGFCREK